MRAVRFDPADMTAPRPGAYLISMTHLTGFRKLIAYGTPSIDCLTQKSGNAVCAPVHERYRLAPRPCPA